MNRLLARMVATAGAALLLLGLPATAQARTATGTTAVGVHNAYDQATAAYLADVLDAGAGMVEIDVWSNFLFSGDFQVGHNPGNANNCAKATSYDQLRTGSRNQNLATCLRNIRLWHDHNPDHPLVVLKVEVKNGFDETNGHGPDEFDRLLASTIGASAIFGPAQLLGGHTTLDAAVRAGGWPSRSALAGRFLVLVERGTFEAGNPFDHYDTDLEYADRLITAHAAGALADALAFPAINGASAGDPRTGDRGGDRAGWFVAFDGAASAYAAYPGGEYLDGRYLVVMTDAHAVAPAIDNRAPSVADAQARVRLLAAKGATIVSSDWTTPDIVRYTVTH
ncbi:Ca2+-dependent phosphoinositide-specific phospholipase C [Goodfellowiella coeruleoviolacea]|uniref:Phosphoinositide phospholipase C, Ca2+-dependent n=1 Tax=Goodfellowiella coeruleoviolacea TaxID=334858 RepID=A0AAE3KE77_9PSEU|nr:Ca2+-dependent phosphoinositide-specific phospholipase C [Goodfellowiella coeruleoviolacea]MCP2163565.1 Phosphoinositide phospholipase C, Ca2+-dependent [Goodfellowiella coeruleoviolacea]